MKLTEVIAILASLTIDDSERQMARKELRDMKHRREILTGEEQLAAIRAAAHGPPVSENDALMLMELVAFNPNEITIPCIESLFFTLPPTSQSAALESLCRCFEVEGAEAFLRMLRECKTRGLNVEFPNYIAPRHLETYFPHLLEIANGNLDWQAGVAKFLKHTLEAEGNPEITDSTVAVFVNRSLSEILSSHSLLGNTGDAGWQWSDEAQQSRYRATSLLQLVEVLPAAVSRDVLAEGMRAQDPLLRHNFLVAHFVAGLPVESRDVEFIAADSCSRMYLYHELKKMNRMDLLPAKYATNVALAESQMVNWLVFPTELGRSPDEIELMSVHPGSVLGESAEDDYYVFRFRTNEPHWSAASGWMSGVSGPYRRGVVDGEEASSTFSCFDQWESLSAEVHLKKIAGRR